MPVGVRGWHWPKNIYNYKILLDLIINIFCYYEIRTVDLISVCVFCLCKYVDNNFVQIIIILNVYISIVANRVKTRQSKEPWECS